MATTTTTSTTTSTTTTTLITTTTAVQAAGGQSSNSVSDAWVPLLATLLGGSLALLGSVLVKRWELKKTTRLRMYDELIPAFYRHYSGSSITIGLIERGLQKGPVPVPTAKFIDHVGELRRAGVMAGRKEAKLTEQIRDLIGEHVAYGMQLNLIWHPGRDLAAMDRELERLITELHNHLEQKLTSRTWRQRLRLRRRKRPADGS